MPSHYLNQCWNIVNWTLRNKRHWNLNQNLYIFIQENGFENVVWKMAAILSRPQCVNTLWPEQNYKHFGDDNFRCISLNENAWICQEYFIEMCSWGSLENKSTPAVVMAWRRNVFKLDSSMSCKWCMVTVVNRACHTVGTARATILGRNPLIKPLHCIRGSHTLIFKGIAVFCQIDRVPV